MAYFDGIFCPICVYNFIDKLLHVVFEELDRVLAQELDLKDLKGIVGGIAKRNWN